LNRSLSRTYKHLTSDHYSYPTELLYLPTDMGGLGFPRLSDDINSAKFTIQQRHLHASGFSFRNIWSHYYNGVVHTSQIPSSMSGVLVNSEATSSHSYWSSSLIQNAVCGELSLCRQGPYILQSPNSTIISASVPTHPRILIFQSHRYRTHTHYSSYLYR